MATRLKETDAVVIGMGFSGAILARELTKAGLNVVGLERGADRNPAEEFTLTRLRDELRYVVRLELMQDNSIDTISFRNAPDELALPIRRFGAFLPGEGVGGTGIHWGALHWRFLPTDFRIKSVLNEKYGAKAIPDTMTIQDWPLSYDELEPHYDRFDRAVRRIRPGRQSARQDHRGRQSVRGRAQQRLSEQADQDRRWTRRSSAMPPKASATTPSRFRSRPRARLT